MKPTAMNKSFFKWYPELLVNLTFVLMGIFFGFVLNFYAVNIKTLHYYKFVGTYPYFIGSLAALTTGCIMVRMKIRNNRITFDHFYYMMFGVLALFTSGMFMTLNPSPTETYFGFLGHGICYVAGLSYINVRIAKTQYRFAKLSIPHLMYLLGVAIANCIIHSQPINKHNIYVSITGPIGGLISCFAFMLLGGYITAEVLQHNGKCIYKASLDNDIMVENDNETIFEHKYFPFGDDPNNDVSQVDAFDTQTEYSHILYALFTKGISIMHFYYPFMMIVRHISTNRMVLLSLSGIAISGLTISITILPFVKYRVHFVLACAIKIVALLTFSIIFGESDDDDDLIVFIGFYAVSAYGYSFPDINILSYANFKYNEIVLAAGYILEYTIIGAIQFYTLQHRPIMLDFSSNLGLILPHSVKFIIIIFMIGIIGVFKIPKGRLQKSLFELKNNLYNEKNFVSDDYHVSCQHSTTTSHLELISDSLSSSDEFRPSKTQLFRDQQLIVQKRVNRVLDEQEACVKNYPELFSDALSSSVEHYPSKPQLYRDQQLIVQKQVNRVLDEQEACGSDGNSTLHVVETENRII